MLEVRVPQLVPASLNVSRREHWSARAKRSKREREAVRLLLSQHERRSWMGLGGPGIIVTLTRCSPRRLDDDNAVGAMKAVRDEVAAWLGISDANPRVTWRVKQVKAARAQQGTLVRIEARSA